MWWGLAALAAGGQTTYYDAHPSNTAAAAGSPSPFWTDSTTNSAGTPLWLFRADYGWDLAGNNGVYEKSGPNSAGDAAPLVTAIDGLTPGREYVVYVHYLSVTSEDWRLWAGFSPSNLTLFTRSLPADRVEDFGLSSEPGSNRTQLRGRIGNAIADTGGVIRVYLDDDASSNTARRTWYDGLSVSDPPPPPTPPPGELIAADGAWTWYNDPRALFIDDVLYAGYVKSSTSKAALCAFRPGSGTNGTELFEFGFTQRDDHNNPGLALRADGRLMAFAATHSTSTNIWYRTAATAQPDTPAEWGAEETTAVAPGSKTGYCNPWPLSAEDGVIWHFSRTINYNPTFMISSNGGASWSAATNLIRTGTGSIRPYVKYDSDGLARIDALYTDGHPRDVTNSLYHIFYQTGMLHRTDGSPIKPVTAAPLLHDSGERGRVVYRYRTEPSSDPNDWIPTGRAWCWEIVRESAGTPVCVFTVQVDGSSWTNDRIFYFYARWDASTGQWRRRFIAQAGRPLYSSEDDYAGGIALDPADPRVVYISSNARYPFDLSGTTNVPLSATGRYELFRGVTLDGGLTFTWTTLTSNSGVDHLRPYVPRRSPYARSVIWFRGTYSTYTSFATEVGGLFEGRRQDYAAWRAERPGLAGPDGEPAADAEGDGVPNLCEFALGLDPLVPDSDKRSGSLETPGLPVWSDTRPPSIRYRVDLRRAGVNTTVEASTDLVSWTPIDSAAVLLDGLAEVREAAVEANATNRFFRLRMTLAP